MQQEAMAVQAVCEDCGHEFVVSNQNVVYRHKVDKDVSGAVIGAYLTFYQCPECSRVHFVQVDDQTSIARFEALKTLYLKTAKNRAMQTKKNTARIKAAQSDLARAREELMKQHTGKVVHIVAPGIDVVVKITFSVSGVPSSN